MQRYRDNKVLYCKINCTVFRKMKYYDNDIQSHLEQSEISHYQIILTTVCREIIFKDTSFYENSGVLRQNFLSHKTIFYIIQQFIYIILFTSFF